MATGVAIGVVAAEVLVGLWLLSHVRARRACVAAVALLLAFCAYLLLAYRHVGNANCGCLGRISPTSLQSALVRNTLLALALVPSIVRAGCARATSPRG